MLNFQNMKDSLKIFCASVVILFIIGLTKTIIKTFTTSQLPKENFQNKNTEIQTKNASTTEENDELIDLKLLTWEKVSSEIPWQPRDSHSVIVFKNKLWLFGGLNGNGFVGKNGDVLYWDAPHFSDIWRTEDGITWELLTNEAPWGDRRSMQAEVFQNKIWVMPGWGPKSKYKNEIWSSEDGIKWTLVSLETVSPSREGFSLIAFQNKLWLLGGVNYDWFGRGAKNDIWYSEDGIKWNKALNHANWSPRWDYGLTIFQDKLWLTGGMNLDGNVFKDIWNSSDGINWNLVSENPPWQARQGHTALVYKNKLWLIGRLNDIKNGSGVNDVWFTDDGYNWQKTYTDPQWLGREDHSSVVFQDKIWVLGGMDSSLKWNNDVWFSVLPDEK